MNISPITTVRARSNGLQDYRGFYPRLVSVPTLTQLGFIGFLLERRRERSARRERRRAIRQHLIRALLRPFSGLWQTFGQAQSLKPTQP